MQRFWLFILLLCAMSTQALTPSTHEQFDHQCSPPVRPVDDTNDALWFAFKNEIDAFRACVSDNMDWHNAAADEHRRSAAEVASLWNEFARTQLNAPEDFPWPPKDD